MRNYGLNWKLETEQISDKDWIFGAVSPVCIAEIPPDKREKNLPKGEVQRGKNDMMDCASRGPVNIIETKLNWLLDSERLSNEAFKFLNENEFINWECLPRIELSDAFIAIKSNTTKEGNSMKAPLDTIRKCGIIPKKLMPLEEWMTWEDYHNPKRINRTIENIAKKSLEYFNFNYEKVLEKDIEKMLDRDVLNLAGYAWPEPINGEYPRVEEEPNHVFMGFRNPRTYIFDNYINSVDGDFIKKLTSDYDFMSYGYRIIISEVEKKMSWWDFFKELLKKICQ